jgi:two-component system, OmpR family, copper resistance phosphate regulon response regulator CusR
MPGRILIIEDEAKTAGFLRRGLTESDFTVEVCEEGDTGLSRALAGEHDLVILDVMLPDRDGWSILSEMRSVGNRTPVLFLTARDHIRDRVKGLQLGADDYLVKPFAFAELLARVQSVLRRTVGNQPDAMRIADLEIDIVHQRASRAGHRMELTPKEFALLALLARSMTKPLSRELIAREVWDMQYEGTSNLVDVHVRRLRAKIDDPYDRKLLHTVRGVGYVLEDRG